VRVEVGAEFASMPLRTPVHTRTVNSTPGICDMFHLIRYISQVKGLFIGPRGTMAHNRVVEPRGTRSNVGASFFVQSPVRVRCPTGPLLWVKVYGDLNTFRTALVPQSE
jgi:hypothetical protein